MTRAAVGNATPEEHDRETAEDGEAAWKRLDGPAAGRGIEFGAFSSSHIARELAGPGIADLTATLQLLRQDRDTLEQSAKIDSDAPRIRILLERSAREAVAFLDSALVKLNRLLQKFEEQSVSEQAPCARADDGPLASSLDLPTSAAACTRFELDELRDYLPQLALFFDESLDELSSRSSRDVIDRSEQLALNRVASQLAAALESARKLAGISAEPARPSARALSAPARRTARISGETLSGRDPPREPPSAPARRAQRPRRAPERTPEPSPPAKSGGFASPIGREPVRAPEAKAERVPAARISELAPRAAKPLRIEPPQPPLLTEQAPSPIAAARTELDEIMLALQSRSPKRTAAGRSRTPEFTRSLAALEVDFSLIRNRWPHASFSEADRGPATRVLLSLDPVLDLLRDRGAASDELLDRTRRLAAQLLELPQSGIR